jgi:Holliday junction resolvasome RuvABC DNA-binding subunit
LTYRDNIKAEALKQMRLAQSVGWHTQAQMCDFAVQALMLAGYTEQQSESAVQVVWAERFAITSPI